MWDGPFFETEKKMMTAQKLKAYTHYNNALDFATQDAHPKQYILFMNPVRTIRSDALPDFRSSPSIFRQ